MQQYATQIGIVALFTWAFGPLFNSMAAGLPTFEILSFTFGLGSLIGILRMALIRTWHQLKPTSYLYFLLGFIGIFGNEFFFVNAFKYAPAAHVTLINYFWPVLVVALSWIVSKDKFNVQLIIAALLGFASVGYLIYQDFDQVIQLQYWLGYLFVLLGGIVWSIYILVQRNPLPLPSEMITLYCGLGFIISITFHLKTEVYVAPNYSEGIAVAWLGSMGMFFAFHCWDFAIKFGNVAILSIFSYNNVLLSTFLLIYFKQADFSSIIIISGLGVFAASLLSCIEWAPIPLLVSKEGASPKA